MTLDAAISEILSSANLALSHVSGPDARRDRGAARAWHATSRKRLYLPKMVAGEWSGTMNLTEPQCGTDLGLIKTKAVPQRRRLLRDLRHEDLHLGRRARSRREHHPSRARAHRGRAGGTKGISLFIVPKFLVDADGSLGERNGVSCGSIEHKMGIHGNATCVMNYDGAKGWLIGEANRGLNAMFVMMNEARLGVGVQGLAQSEVAYQNAAAYAKERLQGRALTGAEAPGQAGRPDHRAPRRAARC